MTPEAVALIVRAAEAGATFALSDGRLSVRGAGALRAALAAHGAAVREGWRFLEALAGGEDPAAALLDAATLEAKARTPGAARCADCANLMCNGLCRAAYRLHLPGFGRGLRPGRAFALHDETAHVAGIRPLHPCPCHVPAGGFAARLAGLLAAVAVSGRWRVTAPATRRLNDDERRAIGEWLARIGEGGTIERARTFARCELDATARDALLDYAGRDRGQRAAGEDRARRE